MTRRPRRPSSAVTSPGLAAGARGRVVTRVAQCGCVLRRGCHRGRQAGRSGPGGARRLFHECGACTLQATGGSQSGRPGGLCPHPRYPLPSPQMPLQASGRRARPVSCRRGHGPRDRLPRDSMWRAGPGPGACVWFQSPSHPAWRRALCANGAVGCGRVCLGLPASGGQSLRDTQGVSPRAEEAQTRWSVADAGRSRLSRGTVRPPGPGSGGSALGRC